MTFSRQMVEQLFHAGLWGEEAAAVLLRAQEDKRNSQFKGRWEHQTSDYPPAMQTSLWLVVSATAVEYLKETTPKHFALVELERSLEEFKALSGVSL